MTHDGRALRILVVIDEYTRECLALRVARRLGSLQVIETLADVMLGRGIPEHIRSDNGPEFIAEELRKWLGKGGTRTLYIEPGRPWGNGDCESFNGKLRDEFSDIFNRSQIKVLPHGVDTSFFKPWATSQEARPRKFIFVGAWLRNTAMLARVIPEISRRFPDRSEERRVGKEC